MSSSHRSRSVNCFVGDPFCALCSFDVYHLQDIQSPKNKLVNCQICRNPAGMHIVKRALLTLVIPLSSGFPSGTELSLNLRWARGKTQKVKALPSLSHIGAIHLSDSSLNSKSPQPVSYLWNGGIMSHLSVMNKKIFKAFYFWLRYSDRTLNLCFGKMFCKFLLVKKIEYCFIIFFEILCEMNACDLRYWRMMSTALCMLPICFLIQAISRIILISQLLSMSQTILHQA